MPKPWQPPTARISSKLRSFAEVVRDIRYCVFSINRFRPDPPNQDQRFRIWPLGSGFFVSPTVFLTCNHVVNGVASPHQAGDKYQLLQNMGSGNMKAIFMPNVNIGQELHIYPQMDMAIVQIPSSNPQPYASLSYADVVEGNEIGVAGYPLSEVTPGPNGEPQFHGFVYRVAKGVITSTVRQYLNPAPDPQTADLSTVEVNFLFVPGNSGGPIFDAETGRVLAYVHGFTNREIIQKLADTLPQHVTAGGPPRHIQSLHAIYSLGIRIENVRTELEGFGVTL
jgi:S1-C subfamily serine protease